MNSMGGMGGMDGTSGMSDNSSAMAGNMMGGFMTGPGTLLYSTSWVPMTDGAYAGTCIFLIALGTALRVLLAVKHNFEHHSARTRHNRRHIIVRGSRDDAPRESKSTRATLVWDGSNEREDVVVVRTTTGVEPWRLSTDLPRAIFTTVVAGVGYLLMIAVMTMNVGYFLSVLGGIFLGELVAGRYTGSQST